MYRINMYSRADTVEGHGVLSAYREQVKLVRDGLAERFSVTENGAPGDISHYHTVNPDFFLRLPFAKLRGATVGYVHFLPETVDHSLRLPKPARAIFYKYLITFYKCMDRLVVVNPTFIEKLEAYGISREKIFYIPNFVSSSQFSPIEASEKRNLRKKYELNPDKFTVMCAGQLQTRKGVLDFVDMARRMPELQFIWVGGFSFGQMTDGYSEICKIMKEPPSNLIFTGIVARETMSDYYNVADVMFLPSYGELFPMTILEAMCCGIPILLRDIDIYPKILFDYYLKGKDQDEFENILTLLRTDNKFYSKAKSASSRGHAFYNEEHVLKMWDLFYSSLIEERVVGKTRRKIALGKGTL